MKIFSLKLFIVFPMIVMTVLSCEKEPINLPGDTHPSPIELPPHTSIDILVDIYVAGADRGNPTYWKNGERVKLDLSHGFDLPSETSMAINGDDVYVTGYDPSDFWGYGAIRYWKNREEVFFKGPINGGAKSIFVVDNDVYLAGWENEIAHDVAKYWKNGEEIRLTNGSWHAEANSIVVADGDVYVCGKEKGIAKFWKNGEPFSLSPQSPWGTAKSIAVVGNDVYVVGQQETNGKAIAMYWKNGEAVALTDGTAPYADATSITVDGNDVYVAGWVETNVSAVAMYWKNGERVDLSDGSLHEYATSIAVFEGDVYVCGYRDKLGYGRLAKYWKNGSPVNILPSPTNHNSWTSASSIIVVPK